MLLIRNNLEMANQETKTSAMQAQLKAWQYTAEAKIETFFQVITKKYSEESALNIVRTRPLSSRVL